MRDQILVASILIAAFLLGFNPNIVSKANASELRQPIVIVTTFNPWGMVLGADSPFFAMYSDNYVIYLDIPEEANAPSEYRFLELSNHEAKSFLERIDLPALGRVDPNDPSLDIARNLTSQPITGIKFWQNGEAKQVAVHGYFPGDEIDPGALEKLPADHALRVFMNAMDAVMSLEGKGERWLPDEIEVLFWPFEHAREDPVDWPSDWPGYEDSELIHGELRRIYLPSKHYDRLVELLDSLKFSQGVRFDGKSWSVSYRLPFPHDSGDEQ